MIAVIPQQHGVYYKLYQVISITVITIVYYIITKMIFMGYQPTQPRPQPPTIVAKREKCSTDSIFGQNN